MKLLLFIGIFYIFINDAFAEKQNNYNVGFKRINISSEQTNTNFPLILLFPNTKKSQVEKIGPFEMKISFGGHAVKKKFPLVVISHGSGGSMLGHRTIAQKLVENGFVVALPMHPNNNYQNNKDAGTNRNWINRPKHIIDSIDFLLNDSKTAKIIDESRISTIGYSAGGYTALALAGAKANTKHISELCQKYFKENEIFCTLGVSEKTVEISNKKDKRIKALVLLAPVGILFKDKNSLAEVNIPTLLVKAEFDMRLNSKFHTDVIYNNFKNKELIKLKQVKNAGHFSFLSPFPEKLKKEVGVLAEDNEGFSRSKFHEEISIEIVNYLKEVL